MRRAIVFPPRSLRAWLASRLTGGRLPVRALGDLAVGAAHSNRETPHQWATSLPRRIGGLIDSSRSRVAGPHGHRAHARDSVKTPVVLIASRPRRHQPRGCTPSGLLVGRGEAELLCEPVFRQAVGRAPPAG